MKRVFLLAMFLTILLVFFAACDSNKKSPADTKEPEASSVVTESVVTEPLESTVQETDEPGTVPAETDSTVTDPMDTDPVVTEPIETDPVETKPVETDPVETETDHVHVWGDWQTTKEATCTENGLQERSCACGEKETQDIETIGHTEVIDEAVDPTCTETGLTEGKHCSACKAVLTAQEAVAALGHTPGAEATCTTDQVCTVCGAKLASATGHSFGEWYTTKEPTEAEKGEKRRDCANCDEYETTLIAALAHSHDNWDTITLKAVAPTCTTTGLTEGKKCSGCGETLVAQEVVPATGHSMGSWKQTMAPTCTAIGTEKRECSKCDHYETREIKATGHSYNAVVTAPTCTEKGYTSHTCHCGDSYVDSYVNALGHRFGEWYETKAPTESAQGEKRRDCKNCDEYETTPIAVLAHSHDRWDTVTLDAVAPTCMATGMTEGKKCSGCGETLVAQEVIPANGHTEETVPAMAPTCKDTGLTEGKKCSVCGETLKAQETVAKTNDHTYTDNKDTTCDVCGFERKLDETVVIYFPKDGKYVTGIEDQYTSISGNKKIHLKLTTNKAEAIPLQLIHNADGTVSFSVNGKYLYADGTHAEFRDAGENTLFVFEETDGGMFIRCNTAKVNGRPQYLEIYSDHLCSYGMGAYSSIYVFELQSADGATGTLQEWETGSSA